MWVGNWVIRYIFNVSVEHEFLKPLYVGSCKKATNSLRQTQYPLNPQKLQLGTEEYVLWSWKKLLGCKGFDSLYH